MDDQPRWPRGTPVAPGGHGPGGGRWRDGDGPDWAGKLSGRLPTLTGHHAMGAAGYQWAGGDGPFDGIISDRWLHGHSDTNDTLAGGGEADPDLDASLQPSTAPIEVLRGIDADWITDDEWVESRYMATTVDEGVAREYARGHRRPALLRIQVPAGVGTAAIGTAPDGDDWEITDLESSGEVVLQRGLRVRITGRSRQGRMRIFDAVVELGDVPPGDGRRVSAPVVEPEDPLVAAILGRGWVQNPFGNWSSGGATIFPPGTRFNDTDQYRLTDMAGRVVGLYPNLEAAQRAWEQR